MNVMMRRDKDGQFVIKEEAFKSKTTADGKSLYKRVHGDTFSVIDTQTHDWSIPYAHVKIEAIEIINCDIGDKIDFKILDDTNNTYSGVPGSNQELNQFGFGVYTPDKFFEHKSQYDADLYYGMNIHIDYVNASGSQKDIYVNYILNEVKE